MTYSMNKEDMWVSRIPTPIRYAVEGAVQDDFNNMETDGNITDWNIYAPLLAPITTTDFPNADNKILKLEDKDPYDYARAIRVFEEGNKVEIQLKVYPDQKEGGMLEIDVTDRYGNRPVRIRFDEDGQMKAVDGSQEVVLQTYQPDHWYELKIDIDATLQGKYDLYVNDQKVVEQAALAESVKSVERLSLRTGPYRDIPHRDTPNEEPGPPLPEADVPLPSAVFYVDEVSATVHK